MVKEYAYIELRKGAMLENFFSVAGIHRFGGGGVVVVVVVVVGGGGFDSCLTTAACFISDLIDHVVDSLRVDW